MSTSFYDLTVGTYLRTATAVAGILQKGADHFAAEGGPKWSLKFFVNQNKYKSGGVLLVTNAEGLQWPRQCHH